MSRTSSVCSTKATHPSRSSVSNAPGNRTKRSPSSLTIVPSGVWKSPARSAAARSGAVFSTAAARSARLNTLRTPGSASSSRLTSRIRSSPSRPASGSKANSPISGVAPPSAASMRSKSIRIGWSGRNM